MGMEIHGGMILTGEDRRTQRKTCPSATLSSTNLTWTDRGAKPGLHSERPATNHLSHGSSGSYLVTLLVNQGAVLIVVIKLEE
jgi:hypothetical protein